MFFIFHNNIKNNCFNEAGADCPGMLIVRRRMVSGADWLQ